MGNRLNIKVTKVFDLRKGTSPKGEWEALDFLGKASTQGPEFKYSIFQKKELFPFVKVEAVLDAEIVDKETDRVDSTGNKIIDHSIMNLYVGGKPVIQAPVRSGFQGKSPEQIAMERASIESQTAYNGIIKLMEAKLVTKDDDIGKLALAWAKKRLV